MAKKERGLGIGVSALLGEEANAFRRPVQYVNQSVSPSAPKDGEIRLVPLSQITPNPFQPRVSFDSAELEELSVSIRTLGLIQPITLRLTAPDKYQIISGERRFRASKLAGLSTIPAYIRTADDAGMLEMAIVENVQRSDLDPIETAVSYERLIDECNLTQEQMADRIGKSRVVVTNYLRLLRLPAKVQYDLKVGNITVGHAKVLLGLDDKNLQERLNDEVISEGLSVRALEARVKALKNSAASSYDSSKKENGSTELPDEYYNIMEIVGKYFSNNVTMKRLPSGKGTMTIRFDNDSQMQDFLKTIKEKGL